MIVSISILICSTGGRSGSTMLQNFPREPLRSPIKIGASRSQTHTNRELSSLISFSFSVHPLAKLLDESESSRHFELACLVVGKEVASWNS